MNNSQMSEIRDYGPPRMTVELANICNLHCSYCLRDEDALYHSPAQFLSVDVFRRAIKQARESMQVEQVMFTGGEPTLHPGFADIIGAVAAEKLHCSFVTNGWHFDRVWPILLNFRDTVTHVAFSLDGATREAHDSWRGEGSFARVVRAWTRCWANNFPFTVKVGIRRDTIPQLEQIAVLAARLGAASLSFAHLMPTSNEIAQVSALSLEERAGAEREIALLARILKIHIGIDVGYYNTDLAAPCAALAGASCNIDYRGHLSLCCNLSGFRGASSEADVVSDLNGNDFSAAYESLKEIARTQSGKRIGELTALAAAGRTADLQTGSPCLFCLNTLGKTPWNVKNSTSNSKSLPVIK
jgi:sulfatase maturation enzyme AslB (radical SAM superfamily)